VPPSDVPRTVLLVDDHPGFRRMARLLIQSGGYEVVGEAATAAEALVVARELEPDLVLLDVQLPDGNGADVAVELAALPHPPGVVLTSSYDWDGLLGQLEPRLQQSPVLGFLPKDQLTVLRLTELFR
jgi:DNA-binding NarL/FixJ family response regulator